MTKKRKKKTDGKQTAGYACVRCKHVIGDPVSLGPPTRTRCHIVIEGKPYNFVEAQRVMCEKCKQIHFVKQYHE